MTLIFNHSHLQSHFQPLTLTFTICCTCTLTVIHLQSIPLPPTYNQSHSYNHTQTHILQSSTLRLTVILTTTLIFTFLISHTLTFIMTLTSTHTLAFTLSPHRDGLKNSSEWERRVCQQNTTNQFLWWLHWSYLQWLVVSVKDKHTHTHIDSIVQTPINQSEVGMLAGEGSRAVGVRAVGVGLYVCL